VSQPLEPMSVKRNGNPKSKAEIPTAQRIAKNVLIRDIEMLPDEGQ